MTLPYRGGSVTELSVTDGCQWRGGDPANIRPRKPFYWSILLIHQNLTRFGVPKSSLAISESAAGDVSIGAMPN
jgi:hypothetical protein